jgi:hypothetical protein
MSKNSKLDSLLRGSLIDLADFVAKNNWRGREREVVSLFAFGFLVPRCQVGGPLQNPTQIGLDVAVPQLPGKNRKALVCKDLVLWEESAGTCWDKAGNATRTPIAILEWKAGTTNHSKHDELWLQAYSSNHRNFTGYAVSLNPKGMQTSLSVSLARNGVTNKSWICYP